MPDSFVYGPVPSRRLGRSLGIDLVPYKVCSYDCAYCQLGHTTRLTIERKEYVPIDKVLKDLDAALLKKRRVDCITLAGSGEPTLNSGLDRLIPEIKKRFALPIAVISNGSLFWQEKLREELMDVDYVLPSLDAGDSSMFALINRPHPEIEYDTMVDGLVQFSREYKGKLWLEVMLIKNMNATDASLKKIARQVQAIQPTQVQLNTAYRPPCEKFIQPMTNEELQKAAAYFSCPVELIRAENAPQSSDDTEVTNENDIVTMVGRRPCTIDDISAGLEMNRLEVVKFVERLLREKAIVEMRLDGRVYFSKAVS
jgi:wyosine [tRNA(Phe)-imidazoG37] synthetase (radical SAM superfamily)